MGPYELRACVTCKESLSEPTSHFAKVESKLETVLKPCRDLLRNNRQQELMKSTNANMDLAGKCL